MRELGARRAARRAGPASGPSSGRRSAREVDARPGRTAAERHLHLARVGEALPGGGLAQRPPRRPRSAASPVSSTPNWTPARGSSTCTTCRDAVEEREQHGGREPLQPQQPQAPERGVMLLADGVVVDLGSSRRLSRAYARTCSAGQPDTIRERSRKPVSGPAGRSARRRRAPSRAGGRSRSASSISSRTRRRAPRAPRGRRS